jgi:hypothetical protein
MIAIRSIPMLVLFLFVFAFEAHAQKPVTSEDDSKNNPNDSQSLIEKLGQQSRDLSAPMVLGDVQGDLKKSQIMIYYANENSVEGDSAENIKVLAEWIRSSKYPEVRAIATGIEEDVKKFTATVQSEIEQLQSAREKLDTKLQPGVVIITNQLARQGTMLVATPGHELNSEAITLPDSTDALLKAWPLSNPAVLEAVLQKVATTFPPASHEYVLITKSHGNSRMALTTRISMDTSKLDKSRVIAKLEADMDRDMEKFRKDGQQLLKSDGTPLEIKGGHAIFVKNGQLRADHLGFLKLQVVNNELILVDTSGDVVTATSGESILLTEGKLHMAGDKQPLRVGDQPAVVEIVLGMLQQPIHISQMKTDEIHTMIARQSCQPLVGSADQLVLQASMDKTQALPNQSQTLSPTAHDSLSKPVGKLGVNTDSTLSKPSGSLSPTAHDSLSKLAGSLGVNTDSTLNKSSGSLSPTMNDTLGTGTDEELDPKGEFGVNKDGSPLVYYRGISKLDFARIIRESSKAGMQFPLVFIESCHSHKGFEGTSFDSKDEKQTGIGVVWTSDRYGLKYQTIDYNHIFAKLPNDKRLSSVISDSLLGIHAEQSSARTEAGALKAEMPEKK